MLRATIGFGIWATSLASALALALGLSACDAGETNPPDEGKGQERVDELQTGAVEHGPDMLLRGGKVMTAAGTILETGDVLVIDGRVKEVAKSVEAPEGVDVIDVSGKVVTPGIIDTHTHMGVYASPGLSAHSDGNEAVAATTAYAWARDGIWPQDPQFATARAGGITTAQVLPGSANLIGGRSYTISLKPYARSANDMHFDGAPDGLKMACGENPKRVYGEKGGPQTRMGNVAGYRKAFQEALEYQRTWDEFEAKSKEPRKKKDDDESSTPPTRDFAHETLARVLSGEIDVHMHCYRADEMLLMLELAEEFGFRIRSFHHAVEAYKIADVLAETETSVSIWADWWGFKAEAFDGVRENAALVSQAGGRPIIHSDDAVGIQRLNQEAAKAMYAGRRAGIEISEDEALKWITLNAAWALRIDAKTGSLEPGKQADIVVWDRTPFSVYAKAEQVFIEGERVYDRANEQDQHRTDFDLGFRPGDTAKEVSQ